MDFYYQRSAYDYELPEELIAKEPLLERDLSRLMIIDRSSGNISEIVFRDLVHLLKAQDRLIFNNTKVLPARLYGKKDTGAKVELLLIKQVDKDIWKTLARPGKKLPEGTKIQIAPSFEAEMVGTLENGEKLVRFHHEGSLIDALKQYGQMPIPPYMKREANRLDATRYQTVYANALGAIAAPTAGLHFTEEMLQKLSQKGIKQTFITLHVGYGTFQPMTVTDIREHQMHSEFYSISEEASLELNDTSTKKICVGTTTCRALETACVQSKINHGDLDTNIFIYPGYQFRYVEALLTNFHLPQSSLLMLVSAFGGYDLIREAYQKAVKEKFRFFSYGDAMLIL